MKARAQALSLNLSIIRCACAYVAMRNVQNAICNVPVCAICDIQYAMFNVPVCAMCLGNPRVCATLAFATSLFIVSLPPPSPFLSQLAKLCNSCKYQHCNCFQPFSLLFVVFLTL